MAGVNAADLAEYRGLLGGWRDGEGVYFGAKVQGLGCADRAEYLQCPVQEDRGLRGVAGGHGAAAQARQGVRLIPGAGDGARQVQGLPVPVKAIVMNILSLAATFGVIVWIFQWGHLSGPLGFTSTGTIDPAMPILLAAIMFGLSMDYEMFLLSRIRERYDETGDNTTAVADGLQHTDGMITSLAFLLIIVVGLFSLSGVTFIKLLGVGMIVSLVLDAAVVRVLLVPATMRLLGRASWWPPRPMRRLYARYGISESAPEPINVLT